MTISKAVQDHITVPAHIQACASAVESDLMYGPAYAVVPENIEEFTLDDYYGLYLDALDEAERDEDVSEVYTGPVGDALREFIDALPSELYYEDWSGCILESEPEGYWETVDGECEGDEYDEPIWVQPEPYTVIEGRQIVEALFGSTIAREFR